MAADAMPNYRHARLLALVLAVARATIIDCRLLYS